MGIIPPAELAALPQWLIWRFTERDGRLTKVPHTTMGYGASPTNSGHWSTFEHAHRAAQRPGFANGVGFVFTAEDPYCGIDLDDCYPSDAAECALWGEGILQRFSDSYLEESPSGTGVKIWCRAKAPRCGRWPIGVGAIEIFDHARFFSFTGRSNGVRVVADHQADIEALVAHLDQGGRHLRPAWTIPAIIPAGNRRHNVLVSLAGTMWRRGMTPEAIAAALLVTNQKQCDPPYPPEHIEKIVVDISTRWSRT
jgi:hypothetical protein